MKELINTIEDWTKNNKTFALATVIQTWGSSPRLVGSSMIVSEDMEMAGSVSGGCVETAVVQEAMELIKAGKSKRLTYGVSDEDAWSVGLSCGGKMQVFAERFLAFDDRPEERAVWEKLHGCLIKNQGCVLLTRLKEDNGAHWLVLPNGETVGQAAEESLVNEGLRAYRERKNQIFEYDGEPYFAQVFPPKSQLIIVGAAHITADLVQLAGIYGFETIVIDPRGIFAHKTQFQYPPGKLFDKYPSDLLPGFTLDNYTYTVVLSHDPKIDEDALHLLLRSDVAYIGALGSRRTHAKRVNRLKEAGYTDEEIGRIHAPVGLDIKAKTPKEIALSIMSEIIKVKNEFL